MMVIEARPSTNDDDAQRIKLNELASTPAINPTTPSTPIHPSAPHDNRRARGPIPTRVAAPNARCSGRRKQGQFGGRHDRKHYAGPLLLRVTLSASPTLRGDQKAGLLLSGEAVG